MSLLSLTYGDRCIRVRLTETQMDVLRMRRSDRMSIDRIARVRRTDRPAVRRILARAHERLEAAGVTLPPVPVMRQRTVRAFSLSTEFSY